MKHIIKRFGKVIRFLIAGGTAAVVNLSVFHFFANYEHTWYVLASVYAFFAAFLVSFLLQKYWTFREHTHALVKKQMLMYLVVAAMNILIGTSLLYLFIEYGGLNNLLAQLISQGLIACLSYFVYKHVIFRSHST